MDTIMADQPARYERYSDTAERRLISATERNYGSPGIMSA